MLNLPDPIVQSLKIHETSLLDVSLDVKRDDLIDPIVSGNKLFKLIDHLSEFKKLNAKTLITFGGAYSNHLHATAYMGKKLGIKTVGFIRAEAHELERPTPTLADCQKWGMQLEPISRSEYKLKQTSNLVMALSEKYEQPYWVPEGGAGTLGVKGAERILDGVDQSQYDVVVAACGTGTTISGIINASEPHVQVIGVPVLKGASWMFDEIKGNLSKQQQNWDLALDYHFGGYAKQNSRLLGFIESMNNQYQLPLDSVYTGKAFFGLIDLMKCGKIKKGSRVLFIHTGGLQGNRSTSS